MSSPSAAAFAASSTFDDFALPAGFSAAAAACGLKESGALDVALIVAERPCSAAGVFTTNRVQAAPVLHDRLVLRRHAGAVRAVVANSGCANACTGEPGLADTRHTAERVAEIVGAEPGHVLVLSTGVIGRRLDLERLQRGIDDAARGLDAGGAGARDAARAILTTDTRPKVAAADLVLGGRTVAIRGMAKGAGMIHPNLATMLAVVTTDAAVSPGVLDALLRDATSRTFDRISVDGDMSTNDTVLLLASGAAGVEIGGEQRAAFQAALTEVCGSLARQSARDGEGATRLVEIEVRRARTENEAHAVADAIARSSLVKTAIHGGDPNWGRILAAAGASGVELDPARLSLVFLDADGEIPLVARGLPVPADVARASHALRLDPVRLRLDLDFGGRSATVWTCDLSAEYVAINAHYTT